MDGRKELVDRILARGPSPLPLLPGSGVPQRGVRSGEGPAPTSLPLSLLRSLPSSPPVVFLSSLGCAQPKPHRTLAAGSPPRALSAAERSSLIPCSLFPAFRPSPRKPVPLPKLLGFSPTTATSVFLTQPLAGQPESSLTLVLQPRPDPPPSQVTFSFPTPLHHSLNLTWKPEPQIHTFGPVPHQLILPCPHPT
ncbi:zyxin-like [Vombatus ursinus]|uniref:zyxin-like n=1 Tax=Vombatus ursinus TaxID=29139 RepID=UPI000FFD815B|nr:zyxin-like [Vombatus ursinus]